MTLNGGNSGRGDWRIRTNHIELTPVLGQSKGCGSSWDGHRNCPEPPTGKLARIARNFGFGRVQVTNITKVSHP